MRWPLSAPKGGIYLKRLVAHYVGNNPVNLIDPTGHDGTEPECTEAAIAGTNACVLAPPPGSLEIDKSVEGQITIRVRVSFDGGTAEQQQAVINGIQDVWNTTATDGTKIITNVIRVDSGPSVTIHITDKLPASVHTLCGSDDSVQGCVPFAFVNSAPDVYLNSSTIVSGGGVSNSNSWEYVAAHEFGHVLGIVDRYGAENRPKPGYENDIMGASGGLQTSANYLEEITTNVILRWNHLLWRSRRL